MQFQVPQFIEVEDKIVGPFTFKQFIYILGGLGAAYLFWRLLPVYASIPLIMIVVPFAFALAFFQVNGRPFILSLESGFFFHHLKLPEDHFLVGCRAPLSRSHIFYQM